MFRPSLKLGDLLWLAGVSFALSGLAALVVSMLRITNETALHAISWGTPFLIGYWCCARENRKRRETEISHERVESLLNRWRRK